MIFEKDEMEKYDAVVIGAGNAGLRLLSQVRFDFDEAKGTYIVRQGWPAAGHIDAKTATPKLSTSLIGLSVSFGRIVRRHVGTPSRESTNASRRATKRRDDGERSRTRPCRARSADGPDPR